MEGDVEGMLYKKVNRCFGVSVFRCFSVSVFQCFSVSVFQCFSLTVLPNYRAHSATELPSAQRNRITERTAQPNYRARSATEPQRFP